MIAIPNMSKPKECKECWSIEWMERRMIWE